MAKEIKETFFESRAVAKGAQALPTIEMHSSVMLPIAKIYYIDSNAKSNFISYFLIMSI